MMTASKRTIVLTAFALCAGAAAAPQYPYIAVSPALPIADQDNVVLRIARGMAGNACKAPTYEYPALPFTIEISPLTIYPPAFSVRVEYKEVPVPPGTVVPEVYNPVEYGPVFRLGVLKLGRYTVIDGGKNIGTFDVVKKGEVPAYSIKGRVMDDPYPLKIMSRPVPDVKIVIKKRVPSPVTDPTVPLFGETPVCSTVSGAKGEFVVEKLPGGFYRLYCTHPDFNNASPGIELAADTAITVTMVAGTAAATVVGGVTEITPSGAGIAGVPVEGCTVQVERPAIYFGNGGGAPGLEPGLPPVTLRALTGKNGRYSIPQIPIAYNGEIWLVKAFKGGYDAESGYVALYNVRTDSVHFRLEPPFENAHGDTIGGIVFTMAANKSLYSAGEGVVARYSIRNTTQAPVTFFPFEKNCAYDMTVADPAGTILFRLSDITGGVNPPMGIEFTVKPGETVTETFPTYYLPKFAPINYQPVITLTIAGRLRGKKYDSTEVPLSIKVMVPNTQAQPALPQNLAVPAVTCTPLRDRIVLSVSGRRIVTCTVYALDGKIRRDLSFTKELAAGSHAVAFGPGTTPGGVFIVKIAAGGYSKAFKVRAEGN